ncbi:hypothetical protein Q4601_20705 [Shewanella sp. 1_MG-2023]|uniref:hypothetical protein n=1 Tax=unclassified Shewanella TaxID=196818 RepID=UPI0026E2BDAA|nr:MULTISPECIES: hypothetical protein [unclassified Shewanella]MDO6613906.1 hypothetical protein [Shewanella sp. 7_MG-2023]MDO6773200.1 hypothetical protein [Shewanella sp. 2_MG-2023]MDO6796717.1 hypothetical protein [Shewanella sp. 1_MG-2023]
MTTWPKDLIAYLEDNFEVFIGWCCVSENQSSVYEFENSLSEVRVILKKYSLIGYHCTKLTRGEISKISKYGMSLQNGATLSSRLEKLVSEGSIIKEVAEKLRVDNQCDDGNRANMLWFCFYEPHKSGEHGINRLFKSWGGEALYNSHEGSDILGEVLKNIGIPCVINAIVPMKSIPNARLPWKEVIATFLSSKGFKLDNPTDYEGYSIESITSDNIIDIIEYPTEKFDKLTGCREWSKKINSG